MTGPIKCIAIDDEPLALDVITKFCTRMGGVELQTFSDPLLGISAIERDRPDIVLLDIEMEDTDGLAIARQLPAGTCFIFTTAYLHYAIEGFNLDAVDYLHKPFAYSRFQTAFAKALRRIGKENIGLGQQQSIVVKHDYNNVTIPLDDILYIEAIERYSKIYRVSGECTVSRVLLKKISDMLPSDSFLRVHRSFIISRSKVKSYNRQEIFLTDGSIVPVGRQYAAATADALSASSAGK